jgi:hypothetical protein
VWEFPIVAEVRKLDSRRRAVFPDRFSPGDVFIEEEVADDRVVFRRISEDQAPLVEVKPLRGLLMVQARADAAKIRAAIRADRDAR